MLSVGDPTFALGISIDAAVYKKLVYFVGNPRYNSRFAYALLGKLPEVCGSADCQLNLTECSAQPA